MGNPYAPPGENQRRPQERPTASDAAGRGEAGGGEGNGREPGEADQPGQAHEPGHAQQQGWSWPGGPPPGPPHGPGSQGRPSLQRPAQPAPDSPIMRATSRRVLHFLALMLASVVVSAFPLPWQAGSLLFIVAGIVVGIRALVLAWRGGVRGGLAVMLAVGVAVSGFVGLGMLSLLALWPEQLERQECLAAAVTISATRTCEAEFQRDLDERLGRTGQTGTGTS